MPVVFNTTSAGFSDKNRRPITERQVRGAIVRITAQTEKHLRDIAADLGAGRINLAEWQIQTAETIKTAHVLTGAIGRGGRASMTVSDWGRLGARIREQYAHLNRFAREIENGKLSLAQIERRASLYAAAVRANYFTFEKTARTAAGFDLARRILNARESCKDCLSWSRRGFVPVEQQPAIGELICRSFCKCRIEYARS